MNTAVETSTEAEAATVEVIDTPKVTVKPVSKAAAKAVEKAAYDVENVYSDHATNADRIHLLKEELKKLEARQELYRKVIGGPAKQLIYTWTQDFNNQEKRFIKLLTEQYEDKKAQYIDLSSGGALWHFNKDVISEQLPALAFAVAGHTVMSERCKDAGGYYPVVPRILAIRAELEELTGS